ncbi:MAG: ATP-binding protein, partial [Candidatus Hadarchaeales archaeon]
QMGLPFITLLYLNMHYYIMLWCIILEKFVNREEELRFLEDVYRRPGPQLVVIYGRRRVGKSTLLNYFRTRKPSVYYLCTRGNEFEQIKFMSVALGEFFGDRALLLNPFDDWHSLFTYLSEKTREKRFVWIIDEFPYLISANPGVVSIFQKYWDEYLSKTEIMLVLCGSSIGMMESQTLASGAPLYGRRTGQWRVLPFRFRDVLEFFSGVDLGTVVEFYSITGGIPFYMLWLDGKKTALENVMERIARKGNVLYEEGEFLIREELGEPATYFSIMNAIASGKTKQTEIANAVGMNSTAITRYLSTLMKLGLIQKNRDLRGRDTG